MVTIRTNQIRLKERRGSMAAVAVLLCGLFGLPPALGQDSGSVTVDVDECVELESAEDRLACFGAQVDAALEERDSPDPEDRVAVSQDGEVVEDQAKSDETPTRSERRAAEQRREPESAESEYFGTITAMRERMPNRYVITLDNGQTWEQVTPKWYPLRPGLTVRIYPSNWGDSYRLTGENSGSYIQVRRVE